MCQWVRLHFQTLQYCYSILYLNNGISVTQDAPKIIVWDNGFSLHCPCLLNAPIKVKIDAYVSIFFFCRKKLPYSYGISGT